MMLPEGVLFNETKSIIKTRVVRALLHPLLTQGPSPGDGTHAHEVPHQVHAVTLVEAGVILALVNVDLTPVPVPAWLADTRVAVP